VSGSTGVADAGVVGEAVGLALGEADGLVLGEALGLAEAEALEAELAAGEQLLTQQEVIEALRFIGRERESNREAQLAIDRLTPREREVLQARTRKGGSLLRRLRRQRDRRPGHPLTPKMVASSYPYSSKCLVGRFCELRLDRILGTSRIDASANL
jgi:hypothetical protein